MSRSTGARWPWMIGLTLVMAAGCEQGPRTTHLPLRIAAAADLQRVLPRLLERFEKQTRDDHDLDDRRLGTACRADQGGRTV